MIKTKIRCATKIFKNQKVFLLKTIIVQVKRILLFGLGERHVAGNPKQKLKYYKQLTKSNRFGQIFFMITVTIESEAGL